MGRTFDAGFNQIGPDGQPVPAAGPAARECPECGCCDLRLIAVRVGHGGAIVRRRECRHCGRRMTSREQPEPRAAGT